MTSETDISAAADFHAHIARIEKTSVDLFSPFSPQAAPRTRPFVPIRALQLYLDEHQIKRLLFFYSQYITYWEPIKHHYLRVFAILVSIGKGSFIAHFLQRNHLADDRLPFSPTTEWPEDCVDWFREFRSAQWRFCAAELRDTRLNNARFSKEIILPFVSHKCLKRGTDSITLAVELHPDYNLLTEKTKTNTFVLKICHEDRIEYHQREVAAYRVMKDQDDITDNLVRFHGSLAQGQTHGMLLEYVDGGTLDKFFQDSPTPTRAEDIIKFWESMLALNKVVERIHMLPSPGSHFSYLQGIHHDIKASNILVSRRPGGSNFDIDFKLADLGLADFPFRDQQNGVVRRRDIGSTPMFMPPECYREERDPSSYSRVRKASTSKDIWSLGCVYSSAAVWSVLGIQGLEEYVQNRQNATDKIQELRATGNSGCFHNGEEVLPEVLEMHARVRQERRQNDYIVFGVVELVEDMLDLEAKRPTASECYNRCRKLLKTAHRCSTPRPLTTDYHPAYRRGDEHLPEPPVRPHDPNDPKKSIDPGSGLSHPPRSYSPHIREQLPQTPSSPASDDYHNTTKIANGHQKQQQSAKSPRESINGSATSKRRPYTTIHAVNQSISRAKHASEPFNLQDEEYFKSLDQRDHIFLFDDSTTMKDYWNNALVVFSALGYVVKHRDPDKMEIMFTNDVQEKSSKNREPLLEILRKVKPGGDCDIAMALGRVLQRYHSGPPRRKRNVLGKRYKQKKGVTIYVLTDGVWNYSEDPLCEVVEAIKNMVDKLIERKATRGEVGIQFIQFGDDPKGTENLRVLDDQLSALGVKKDIVDTEPWTGNVFKMLLGSFNANWDNPVAPPPPTPSNSEPSHA